MADEGKQLKRRTPSSLRPDVGQEPPASPSLGTVVAPQRGSGASGLLVKIGIPVVVAIIGVVAVAMWLQGGSQVNDIEPRLPGTTASVPQQAARPGAAVPARADVTASGPPAAATVATGTPSVPAPTPAPVRATRAPAAGGAAVSGGPWPSFRGPNKDGISPEKLSLASSWGSGGPRKLWSVQLGEGYAAGAIRNGRVYVMDYNESSRADNLRCFSLADGSEVWSQSYPVPLKSNHGLSRTVPAVAGKYVVSIGPKCHVMCCDADTGSVVWKLDMVSQYGAKVPPWYSGQCPLIDGNYVILAPGGKAMMIAVELASGKEVWKSSNPNNWQMTHSSILAMSFAGTKMYVYPASGGVVGISAKDGSLLWQTSEWKVSTANVPTPVPLGDGRIFVCGGYGAGAAMLRLSGSGSAMKVSVAQRLKPDVFGSHQQTPILYGKHIYGVIPSKELSCIDLNGNTVWKSGSTNRFGINPYIIADGKIYVMTDAGELVMAEASPAGYKELGRAKILSGGEPWGPLAISGGRLLARDLRNMVCVDVSGT